MFSLVAVLLIAVLWFASTAIIIKVDAARQRTAAKARGDVDFMDRSVTPYMLLAFIAGPLPLIFYFGTTRKKGAGGWLLGLGVFAANSIALVVAGSLLMFVAGKLDGWTYHRKNVASFERAHAVCTTPPASANRAEDPCSKSLEGVIFTTAYGNDADQHLEIQAYDEACDSGRAWACARLLDYGYAYGAGPEYTANVPKWTAQRAMLCAKTPFAADCAPSPKP